MRTPNRGFEGTVGRVAGAVMARLNRDMELAAIDELALASSAEVLAVGFGPGVGIAALRRARASSQGRAAWTRRPPWSSRRASVTAPPSGRAGSSWPRQRAEMVPWPDGVFDAAVAVNSMQLWDPLPAAVRELARVLRPGGVLVALTHTWAVEKRMATEEWTSTTRDLLQRSGFTDVTVGTRTFRSGTGLVQHAERLPARRDPSAPGDEVLDPSS